MRGPIRITVPGRAKGEMGHDVDDALTRVMDAIDDACHLFGSVPFTDPTRQDLADLQIKIHDLRRRRERRVDRSVERIVDSPVVHERPALPTGEN